jgi:hypothetical protein
MARQLHGENGDDWNVERSNHNVSDGAQKLDGEDEANLVLRELVADPDGINQDDSDQREAEVKDEPGS